MATVIVNGVTVVGSKIQVNRTVTDGLNVTTQLHVFDALAVQVKMDREGITRDQAIDALVKANLPVDTTVIGSLLSNALRLQIVEAVNTVVQSLQQTHSGNASRTGSSSSGASNRSPVGGNQPGGVAVRSGTILPRRRRRLGARKRFVDEGDRRTGGEGSEYQLEDRSKPGWVPR